MKNLILKFIAFGSMAFVAPGVMGQESDARILRVINPSQSIGIRIGDVLDRKIEIEVKSLYQLSRNTFPVKGSNQNGIELADIKVNTSQREQKTIYMIDLRYQVFANAPAPGVMQLPTEEFALTGGPKALSIKVPVWRFWFSPLVAVDISNAKENLHPQYKPALIDLSDHQHRLAVFLGLLFTGFAGLIYINADRRWLPFMNGAFAQAYRNLKKLPKNQDQEKKALLYMHQTFNKVHGANLFANDIAQFLVARPEFSRLKTDIESFFERSNKSLFANQNHDSEQFINDLISLSKSLRDCERGV